MQHRKAGTTQEVAAAKAGLSVRSGRRIEHAGGARRKAERDWRTREDPLEAVWSTELVLLLEKEPSLTGTTLLDYLEEHYPEHYDQRILRTLQRRVKQWKALHGPDREVMFRQQAVVSQQAFSDFTHPDSPITIQGKPFSHLLYQFRLAYSGWRSVTVVQGGESYAALACGLQRALKQAGGSPLEHRTDSLSAARKNRENAWTDDYTKLCEHYGMQPTRNNPGQSHENGVVECANGSLKQRLSQQLKLRGHANFDSVDDYQSLIDKVVDKLNRRTRSRFDEEQASLQPLPGDEMADYGAMESLVARASLRFTPNDSSEYLLIVEDGSMDGDGTIAQGWALFSPSSHKVSNDNKGLTDINWTQVTFESSWDVAFGDGSITNILARRKVESLNNVDIDSSPVTFFDANNFFEQDQVSNEIRYNGSFGNADITSGVYYFSQDMFTIEQRSILGGALLQHSGGKMDHEALGVFTQLDYHITDDVILRAGLRYSREEKDAKISPRDLGSCDLSSRSCSLFYEDSKKWDFFIPRVGFSWEFKDDMHLYSDYSKGFRSGSFNLRQATSAIPGVAAFPAFDEEEQDAFEMGFKSWFNERRTKLNVAIFYSELKDMQKDVAEPVTLNQFSTNTADAKMQGVEIEFNHQISDGLLLSINYGYLDAEYTDILFDLNGDGVINSEDMDLDLTRAPKSTWGIALTHELDFDHGGTLLTHASYAYRDKMYMSDNNQLPLQEVEMVNLFVTYFSENRWSVSVYGKNLLDEVIHSGATFTGLAGGTFSPIGGKGRVYGVEFEYNFD